MDINELAKRIQVLEDIEAIKQLKAEYADACDDKYNPERMRNLFTKDAIWDGEKGGFGKHEGLDAVCAFFGAAKDILTFGVHWFLQPRIKILSDTEAEGVWYLWQTSTTASDKDIFLAQQAARGLQIFSINYRWSRVSTQAEHCPQRS